MKKEIKNDSCPVGFDMLNDKSCVHKSVVPMSYDRARSYCDGIGGANLFFIDTSEGLEALKTHEFKYSGT